MTDCQDSYQVAISYHTSGVPDSFKIEIKGSQIYLISVELIKRWVYSLLVLFTKMD